MAETLLIGYQMNFLKVSIKDLQFRKFQKEVFFIKSLKINKQKISFLLFLELLSNFKVRKKASLFLPETKQIVRVIEFK
jgi:hypothetical protein